MELNYDWKKFQALFYSKKRLPTIEETGPIFAITKGNIIVSLFSEGEDLIDWIDATEDELCAEYSHRELFFYDLNRVDSLLRDSVEKPHFYDQTQFVRRESRPKLVTRTRGKISEHPALTHKHFLLSAVQSWWRRLLPTKYGIYLSLDNPEIPGTLLMFQRGRLDSFSCPDLSGMIPERRKFSEDIVKYLKEMQLVPIQGIFLSRSEWVELSESPQPWKKALQMIRADRSKVAPVRWGVLFLVFLRAFFGL